jgi:hypothetical protein
MDLLYFTDISQVSYVVDHRPELMKNRHAMTGDVVVAYELERLGIDFIDEWDLLGAEDIEANFETARLLSTTWWDESLASTEYEGFALSEAAQQDMIYPFEASLNARTVYRKLFSTCQIRSIAGFFLPSVGVYRTGPIPTNRAVRSVAQAVLFYMAEKQGIAVEKLESDRPLSEGTLAFKSREIGQIQASIFAEAGNSLDKIVLVYEDGMYPDEYSVLIETLKKFPRIKAISISQRVLELGQRVSNLRAGIGSRFQYFQNKLLESVKSYDGMYPEIFGNVHLQFQLECISREMIKAVEYGDVYAAVLDIVKPSLVVFGHEAFTRERTFIRLAKKRNISSVGLMHGVARHRFTYRGIVGDADQIMVANDTDIEGLASHGIDRGRLNKVGCLRYEEIYLKNKYPDSELNLSNAKKKAKVELGLDPTKPVIVWTTAAINAGFASPIAEPRKHREAIKGFLDMARLRPDLQFIIKAHPSYDYYQIYRMLLDQKLPNIAFAEKAILSDVVIASDICLMINYCTTAALEAMLNRVPVVYLNNAVYCLEDRQDNLTETGMHRVNTIDELEIFIDGLLTSPKIKAQALTLADQGLRSFLEIDRGRANSKLYDYMSRILREQPTKTAAELPKEHNLSELLLFLESKKSLPRDYFSELGSRHSGTQLMFAISYLAGLHSLGFSSLSRVYEMIKSVEADGSSVMWGAARWEYLPVFIAGKMNSAMGRLSRTKTFSMFGWYALYPHKYFSAPASFRRNLKSHVVKVILGEAGISIVNWVVKKSSHLRKHKRLTDSPC